MFGRGEGLGVLKEPGPEAKFGDLGEDAESRGTRYGATRYFLSFPPSFSLSFPPASTAAAAEFCRSNPLPLLVTLLTFSLSWIVSSSPQILKSQSFPRFGNSSLTTFI